MIICNMISPMTSRTKVTTHNDNHAQDHRGIKWHNGSGHIMFHQINHIVINYKMQSTLLVTHKHQSIVPVTRLNTRDELGFEMR